MRIGVLALQGGFAAHQRVLQSLGADVRLVRLPRHLEGLDGLVLPGGESTTMLKLIREFQLWEPLVSFCKRPIPVLGTCAGAILMARHVSGWQQDSLALLPVSIQRNAYGAQQESFRGVFDCPPWSLKDVQALFIRAPKFAPPDPGVTVLSRWEGAVTGVQWQNLTATTYHPELSGETRFHEAWLQRAGH